MSNIFGDTDDITFGGQNIVRPQKSFSKEETPASVKPVRSRNHYDHGTRDRSSEPIRKPEIRSRKPEAPFTPPTPSSPSENLKNLVASMKPTYLPVTSSDQMRLISLSPAKMQDPLFVLRGGDSSIIFGTGYGMIENVGISYPSLPDLRLIDSERERLS
jgi:hypothetical protein